MRNILTIGSFDMFHRGHVELLDESGKIAKQWNARLIVGVNTDEFITRYKGREPWIPMEDRMAIVSGHRDVSAVLVNIGDEDSKPLIEVVNPIRLTIGDDWLDYREGGKVDEERYFTQLGVTERWMRARNLYVEYIPRTTGTSSSELKRVLRKD